MLDELRVKTSAAIQRFGFGAAKYYIKYSIFLFTNYSVSKESKRKVMTDLAFCHLHCGEVDFVVKDVAKAYHYCEAKNKVCTYLSFALTNVL